jgi:hypothetical protein
VGVRQAKQTKGKQRQETKAKQSNANEVRKQICVAGETPVMSGKASQSISVR